LVLRVLDTGTGISVEDQESIFLPFERGRAAKESDSGGSGVGLSVVDRLVEELGLTLDVFSEYGHGSSFEVILPATKLRRMPAEPATEQ
jgi:signal transduction histidine kinase